MMYRINVQQNLSFIYCVVPGPPHVCVLVVTSVCLIYHVQMADMFYAQEWRLPFYELVHLRAKVFGMGICLWACEMVFTGTRQYIQKHAISLTVCDMAPLEMLIIVVSTCFMQLLAAGFLKELGPFCGTFTSFMPGIARE